MYIEQLYTNCLAEAAYYIESEGEAAVIDPVRETEPYVALAKKRGAAIRYVFETHFHADFVSGHIDLAREVKATIVYGPEAETGYDVHHAVDGEEFRVGKVTLRTLHTPGHTPESTCYLLLDEQQRPHAVFTGDTLFVGDVGRPDLLDGVMSKEELAGKLFDSLHGKIKPLPDDVIVYPAHGPGSACGKSIGKETFSTIGQQKKTNYALLETDKDAFIRKVTDGIQPPPAYFMEDTRINKFGYAPVQEVVARNLRPLSQRDVEQAMHDGAWVLDTRMPSEFATGFIPGALNIGLNGRYAIWAGTLIPMTCPLVLVTAPGKEQESVLRLARVGFEKVVGYLDGGMAGWKGPRDTVHTMTAEEFAARGGASLDVRKADEFNAAHLDGAVLAALNDFPSTLGQLDKSVPWHVYCATGYRSMIASSLMKRAGFRDPVNINGGMAALGKTDVALVAHPVATTS